MYTGIKSQANESKLKFSYTSNMSACLSLTTQVMRKLRTV